MITWTRTGEIGDGIKALADDAKQGAREAGKLVARDVKKLILAGAGTSRFMGKKLNVKYRLHVNDSSTVVETYGTPAGAWSILESGRRGGYTVKPKRAKVLAAGRGDVIGMTARPGAIRGRSTWTKATESIGDDLEPIIRKAFDKAFEV